MQIFWAFGIENLAKLFITRSLRAERSIEDNPPRKFVNTINNNNNNDEMN